MIVHSLEKVRETDEPGQRRKVKCEEIQEHEVEIREREAIVICRRPLYLEDKVPQPPHLEKLLEAKDGHLR